MECPKCQKAMVTQQESSYEYKECSGCHGLWMRHRALRSVIKERDPEAVIELPRDFELEQWSFDNDPTVDTNNITNCPLDGHTYIEREFGGVYIDMCSKCDGIWLDAGELAKIKKALEDGKVPHSVVGTIIHNIAIYLSRFSEG